jgi:hypothetical protein
MPNAELQDELVWVLQARHGKIAGCARRVWINNADQTLT